MKWGNIYREKLKGVNKNTQDYEEEELLQQEKWCALAEILDEYEAKIEELENKIELMKMCDNCTYNRREYENIHDMCHSCKKHSEWKIKQ